MWNLLIALLVLFALPAYALDANLFHLEAIDGSTYAELYPPQGCATANNFLGMSVPDNGEDNGFGVDAVGIYTNSPLSVGSYNRDVSLFAGANGTIPRMVIQLDGKIRIPSLTFSGGGRRPVCVDASGRLSLGGSNGKC